MPGVNCCTGNSNLRHCSDLEYKHHSLVLDYLDEFDIASDSSDFRRVSK